MLSLISDVPEWENLSPTKKIVSHAYVKKSKKEDGTGSSVHELSIKIKWFLFSSFKNRFLFFVKKNFLSIEIKLNMKS